MTVPVTQSSVDPGLRAWEHVAWNGALLVQAIPRRFGDHQSLSAMRRLSSSEQAIAKFVSRLETVCSPIFSD